jgi:hypothetical protein
MEYYTNINIDYLDDDFILQLTIAFDSKIIGEEFINYFNSENIHENVYCNKKYPLIKYYEELNFYQPKPNKSITNKEFDIIINKINETIDGIKNKYTFEIYDKYFESILDDFIFVNLININSIDHAEKYLFNLQFIKLHENTKKNIKLMDFFAYDDLNKKIIKDEYNKYLSTSLDFENIIGENIFDKIIFSTDYIVFCSVIELALLETKYELKINNIYKKKNNYDYANEIISEWKNILYSDPINFTVNLEIKKFFSPDILNDIQSDIDKLIEQNIIKPNIVYKPYLHEFSNIYNKFIHPRYLQYIEECSDL